jgi:UDP-N-acetylmuramoyl-tripeptide--D-alanyl-D-alanine ligase
VESRTSAFACAALGGVTVRAPLNAEVNRVSTDSRTIQPGDWFLALRGDNFDGHEFLEEVARKGASAVVIETGRASTALPSCGVIEVANTRAAFGQLAAAYRAQFPIPVIAVGGSNGKTTTKELIASVLRVKLPVLWSEASFNNDIGVPTTLLNLDSTHRAAVLEAGTNHPGELAPLLELIRPRFGVITNIGREHLEFFGDVAGVAQEEGAMCECLPADGKLFINGDSEWSDVLAARTRAEVVRVGEKECNTWRARAIQLRANCVTFRLDAPRKEFAGNYRVNLLGRHQVMNALFAIAIGAELGLTREEIAAGLEACEPPKMRMQSWETAAGARVLEDCYNANADSMAAALEVLRDLPCKGRRVAVLGDMAELGAHGEAAHREVGRQAALSGVDHLIAVGGMAGELSRGARDAGLNRVLEIAEVEAAGGALKAFLRPGDLVLLKASRATRLERIARVLREK